MSFAPYSVAAGEEAVKRTVCRWTGRTRGRRRGAMKADGEYCKRRLVKERQDMKAGRRRCIAEVECVGCDCRAPAAAMKEHNL